jgi:fibronectin-binding autotransporter adhesin
VTVATSPNFTLTSNLPTLSATSAYYFVMSHAGDSIVRDSLDTLFITQAQTLGNGTTGYTINDVGPDGGMYTHASQTGLTNGGLGTLTLATRPAGFDSDNDGIPDAWETAHGMNPNSAADALAKNPFGYFMIEQYINEVGATYDTRVSNAISGSWSTASNWTGPGTVSIAPTPYDYAKIRGNGTANGALVISSGSASAMTVAIGGNGPAAGETLTVTGGKLDVYDQITVGDQNNATMTISGSGIVETYNLQVGNSISGSTYTGTLNLNGGTLTVAQIALGGGSPGNWTTGGTLNWNGGKILGAGTLMINVPTTLGAVGVIDSNGYSGTFSGAITGGGSLTKSGAGILVLTGSNSYSGGTTIQGGELDILTDANIGGPTSTITFAGGLLQLNSTSVTNLNSHMVNWSTFNGGFDTNAAMNFTVPQSIGGSGSVTITGTSGTVTLSGTNTYTGGTTVAGGQLIVTDDTNLGAAGSPLTLTGGRFRVNGTTFTNLDNHPLTLSGTPTIDINTAGNTFTINQSITGSGGFTKAGAGVLVLTANNSFSGVTTVTSGILRLANSQALRKSTLSLTTSGVTIDFAGINPTLGGLSGNQPLDIQGLTMSVGNNNGSTTYSGVMSNSAAAGVLVKIGTGTLTLAGKSTYTTPTTISGGVIAIGTLTNGGLASALGASSSTAANLVLDSGTLQYTGTSQTFDRLFTLTAKGGALDGSGTGGFTFGSTGQAAASGTGDRTLTLTGSETHSNYSFDIADPVGGKTSLYKTGSGRWLIGGTTARTYSGDTHIVSGTLHVFGSSTAPIPHGAGKGNLVIDAGALLELNNYNVTINGLNGAGTCNLSTGVHTLTVGDGDANGSFSGIIQDTGTLSLAKIGAGTQILSGANTYVGTTTISGGVLQFNSAGSIGGSGATVTVNAPGVFAAGYAMDQTFLGRIAAGSTGVAALAAATSNALSFNTAALANVSLGAVGSQTYSSTLTPNGTAYRLGGGGGTLTMTAALNGVNSLIVNGAGTSSTVVLANAANNFTTPISINSGTLEFAQNLSQSAASLSGPGTLQVDAGATVTSDGATVGGVIVNGNWVIRPNGLATGTSTVSSIAIGTGAKVDLSNNALIVQSTGANKASLLAMLNIQVNLGHNNGNWAGTGITSSTAAADPNHKTVVAIDNALLGLTTFGGASVDGNSILVEATWLGDTNLDRKVDVTDLGMLATKYGQTVTGGMASGDFNNDGRVDVTDLGMLATNYGTGTGGVSFALGLSGVPEPASLSIGCIGGILLLRRRERR